MTAPLRLGIIFLFSFSLLQAIEIISFNQSAETAMLHSNITFVCETIGWPSDIEINDRPYDLPSDSQPNSGFYFNYRRLINGSGGNSHYIISVTIVALEDNNNTKVSCYVPSQDRLIPPKEQNRFFIIVVPPTMPQPTLSYSQEDFSLRVSWNESIAHPRFPVTNYTVLITNTSDPFITTTVDVGGNYSSYVDKLDHPPSGCYELVYSVTAQNEIGQSKAGSVSGGFPITLQPVTVQSYALYQQNGAPHLEIAFQSAYSCSFQEVDYTVYIEGPGGEVLNNLNREYTGNSSEHLYSVHSGLTSGASYTVVVEARSIAGVTVTRQEIVVANLSSVSCDEIVPQQYAELFRKQIEAYTGIIGGLTVIAVILIALSLFICLYCKRINRVKVRNHTASAVQSLPMGTTNLNPIYEGGPIYESPTGEPLRPLLSSSQPSTPTTPQDASRYTLSFTSPFLPPPRNGTVPSNNIPPCGQGNSGSVSKDEEAEYTVMKPANAAKPSS